MLTNRADYATTCRKPTARTLAVAGWFLLLLSCGTALMAVARLAPRPHLQPTSPLVTDPEVIDFGHVAAGKLPAFFRLTNGGATELEIQHVMKMCDCTDVRVPNAKLKPGEFVQCELQWDTMGKRGASTTSIDVYYRDTVTERRNYLRIPLFAEVIEEYEPAPGVLEFGPNNYHSRSVRLIERVDGYSPRILAADCTHPAFRAVVDDRDPCVVAVEFDPSAWHGASRYPALRIQTNSKAQPSCEVALVVARENWMPSGADGASNP